MSGYVDLKGSRWCDTTRRGIVCSICTYLLSRRCEYTALAQADEVYGCDCVFPMKAGRADLLHWRKQMRYTFACANAVYSHRLLPSGSTTVHGVEKPPDLPPQRLDLLYDVRRLSVEVTKFHGVEKYHP